MIVFQQGHPLYSTPLVQPPQEQDTKLENPTPCGGDTFLQSDRWKATVTLCHRTRAYSFSTKRQNYYTCTVKYK